MSLLLAVLLMTAAAAYTQEKQEAATDSNKTVKAAAAPVAQGEAPDLSNDGTFVRLHLQGDFVLDPYVLRVLAGSGQTAANVDEACAGEIGEQPNVVLDWSGETELLNIFVYSDQDTTLLVRTPDGDVLCNDDADTFTVDPLISLEAPAAGNYEIFVGSTNMEGPVHGFLAFTELDIDEELATLDLAPMLDRQEHPSPEAFSLPTIDLSRLRVRETAAFGTTTLEDGFETVAVTAVAGGEHPVFGETPSGSICAGFFSIVPAYSFTWTGSGDLSVFFEATENASMLVVTPDGVICNDNSETDNLNPTIDIMDAVEGEYDIHIGGFDPAGVVIGNLTITNDTDASPEPLTIDESGG